MKMLKIAVLSSVFAANLMALESIKDSKSHLALGKNLVAQVPTVAPAARTAEAPVQDPSARILKALNECMVDRPSRSLDAAEATRLLGVR